MIRQLEAVYEQGVLRPLEPLALPEHQRVRLTLEDRVLPQNGNAPEAAAAPVNHRREEFPWLATESGPYAGQAGGDQPHNNLMPYLTLTFCIALQGVFPPRT
jgi:microcystin-dependent protein